MRTQRACVCALSDMITIHILEHNTHTHDDDDVHCHRTTRYWVSFKGYSSNHWGTISVRDTLWLRCVKPKHTHTLNTKKKETVKRVMWCGRRRPIQVDLKVRKIAF